MRRDKRYRNKPLPVKDLQTVAAFRAEMQVYAKLRAQGLSHLEAMRKVFPDGK